MSGKFDVRSAIHGVRYFLTSGIWDIAPATLSPLLRPFVRMLRFVLAVGRGFMYDRCALHASALTYYTLMIMVPGLALALALGRVFGGAEIVRHQFEDKLSGFLSQLVLQSEGANVVANEASNAFAEQLQGKAIQFFDQINAINFGTLGGIGAAALIWMVISLLGKIESSFNFIYGVPQPRNLWRKFTDYLSVVLIFPFLLTIASTLPVLDMAIKVSGSVGGSTMAETVHAIASSGALQKGMALGASTAAFSFLLIFMPNTRIKLMPGVIGGFLTAVLFNLWLILCAHLQVGIVRYSALYGGFALLPILLTWVYVSWEIILLGAEVVFALQNGATCRMEADAGRASPYTRFMLAVVFCAEAARALRDRGEPFNATGFAFERGISSRLTQDVLDTLTRGKLLAAVVGQSGSFLPQRDMTMVSGADVAKLVFNDGTQPNDLGLQSIDQPLKELGANLLIAIDQALPVSLAGICDR